MSKYSFGDIAINSTVKKKPEPSDKATYIGLEHLNPGCLTVRRFGADVAPVGDKLVMKKGDVLFGKRRAYQKKVAIAPFDGIFSAHGMVLRPKTEVIDKDFFPLFIASDYFLDAAIKISVGSLSPTINWNDLKRLEFSLPPLEEQRRLAEVLWSAIELKEAYQALLSRCDEMASSRFIELFGDPIENPKGWPRQPISAFAQVKIGPFGSVLHAEDYIHDGYPLVNPSHLHEGKIIVDKTLTISEKKYKELTAYHLHPGDIVIGRRGEIGRCAMVTHEGLFCGTGSLFVRIENCCRPDFLQSVISYPAYKKMLEDKAVGVTMKNINAGMIEDSLIPLPPLAIQNEFAAFIEQLDKSKVVVRQNEYFCQKRLAFG